MLRNQLERAVWAAAFVSRSYDPPSAANEADLAVLNLRNWEIANGSRHVLDMTQHVTEEGELDLEAVDE